MATAKINIFTDLKKRIEMGYTVVDCDGNFIKEDSLKKRIFKDYNKAVMSMEIDPTEVDFNKYFESKTNDFVYVTDIIEAIEDFFVLDEEEEDESQEDTEAYQED